jgi:hypothetical protein
MAMVTIAELPDEVLHHVCAKVRESGDGMKTLYALLIVCRRFSVGTTLKTFRSRVSTEYAGVGYQRILDASFCRPQKSRPATHL